MGIGGIKGLVIYCDRKIKISTNNNIININENFINIETKTPQKVFDELLSKYKLNSYKEIIIESIPVRFTKAETLLLIAIGIGNLRVYCNSNAKNYEITFSYNFPIILEKNLVEVLVDNIEKITKAQLIDLGEENDFIRVNLERKEEFKLFKKRVKYLVNKNDKDIEISYNYSLDSVLTRWKEYCINKFNTDFSQNAIDVYKKVYSQSGFSTITYLYKGDIIAQGIIFVSEFSKTIYYCIFAWDETFKKKSPGIYAYCKIIYACYEKGFKFSFCYGMQEYKLKLLREFTDIHSYDN